MTILDQLAAYAKERTRQEKKIVSLQEIRRQAFSLPPGNLTFEEALQKPGLSFICECKKASPSKGIIAPYFPYQEIAKEYEAAGADCISVLTEPKWFLGSNQYLEEIAGQVSLPCLRKDFTVDEYMIYQAKILGAKAVLLICSILTERQLKEYLQLCDELGLSALVEAHDEEEIQTAIRVNARIIGVNNRNLKDFSVNMKNSQTMRNLVPKNTLFISESGIRYPEEIKILQEMGADGVLIGEVLMNAPDKNKKIKELRGFL